MYLSELGYDPRCCSVAVECDRAAPCNEMLGAGQRRAAEGWRSYNLYYNTPPRYSQYLLCTSMPSWPDLPDNLDTCYTNKSVSAHFVSMKNIKYVFLLWTTILWIFMIYVDIFWCESLRLVTSPGWVVAARIIVFAVTCGTSSPVSLVSWKHNL